MLSAVIHSEHSYSAVHLAVQPIDQRFVHPGPLVVSDFSKLIKFEAHKEIVMSAARAERITIYRSATKNFAIFRSHIPLFLGAQTISSPVHSMCGEDDGMLQIGAVIFKEMIPLPIRPARKGAKSLRGQTQSL
jgi:hypothetical protein